MFDVGFSELVVIALVALIVLGPQRLPEVARTVGRWVGRAQRMVEKLREDLDRELKGSGGQGLGDLRQELEETRELIARSSRKLEDSFTEETRLLESSVQPEVKPVPEAAPAAPATAAVETAPIETQPAPKPKRKPRKRTGTAKAARRKPAEKQDGGDA